MGNDCYRKFFEEFCDQFFVKTVERSTDAEELNMTTNAQPNQISKHASKFESWFQLGFCESKMKTQKDIKRTLFRTVLKV